MTLHRTRWKMAESAFSWPWKKPNIETIEAFSKKTNDSRWVVVLTFCLILKDLLTKEGSGLDWTFQSLFLLCIGHFFVSMYAAVAAISIEILRLRGRLSDEKANPVVDNSHSTK